MNKAFTLIETILYISIVTIILIAVSRLGGLVINNNAKSHSQEEVADTARAISERITFEIRTASGITSVGATSISLANFAPDTTTVISWVGDNIQISKNGAAAVNINPAGAKIADLTFTNYTSAGSETKNIGFTLTVTQSYTGPNQIFKATTSLRSTVELRSN